MAFDLAYRTQFQFIRDQRGEKRRARNKKKALRRFGMIVRQQGRKNIKRGKIKKLEALTAAGVKVSGFAAYAVIKNGSGQALNVVSISPEPNLRTIYYGLADNGNNVLIGPVGLGSKTPTVPEVVESQFPFMGPALESRYDELAKSIERFGLV